MAERVKSIGIDCIKESLADACWLTYLVGTTGLQGGDAGHGARAVVALRADDGCCIGAYASKDCSEKFEDHPDNAERTAEEGTVVSIVANGDAEIRLLAEAFGKISRELNRKIKQSTKRGKNAK